MRIKRVDFVQSYYQTEIIAILEDGNSESLFKYYPDELSFNACEFIGKTVQEGREVFTRKDIAYLRS